MDDLYDDLENYNDVNAFDEIRNENKKLRFKLQEYAASVDKLQKDLDKVTSDFKTLEINYSSLLKTARAEIERKTQIIANLNAEKDSMVLNALQNSNKSLMNIRRNMTRDRSNLKKTRNIDLDPVKSNLQSVKKHDLERDRKEECRLPSIDTVSSGNTDNTNNISNTDKQVKPIPYHDKSSESKENISKGKTRAQGLRNRRKSMPVLSKQFEKFSSDEEFAQNYSAGESSKKDCPSRDEKPKRNYERSYNDKHSHKVSETSGIDEKYSSYHESSRETYYKEKSGRYSDKYRNPRDKYEPQRYRKHFSPEKARRGPRDYSGEPYQRPDSGWRNRVLESPPVERPHDAQRRNRDRRSNYDRGACDERRVRQDKHPEKHKMPGDYEEPSSKRAKTDSYSRPPEEERRINEHQLPEGNMLAHRIGDFNTSCQSPDYAHADTVPVHPVKEIMSTAATPLEDPRLASKKYILKTDDDYKVSLSTVTGRNVDLDVIDKYTWGVLRVDVPEALQCPPQYNVELVNDVYMDMDNPISNMSIESGEIQSENNDVPPITQVADIVTENFKDYQHEENTGDHVREDIVEVRVDLTEDTEATKLRASKYRIPKIKKPDKDHVVQTVASESDNPLGLLLKDFHAIYEQDKIVSDKVKSCEVKESKPRDNVETPLVLDNKNIRPRSAKNARQFKQQRKLSSRELVQGDLELSDDDCLDNQKKNTKVRTSNKSLHNIKTQNQVQAKKGKSKSPKTEEQLQENKEKENSSKHKQENVTVKDDNGKLKAGSIGNITETSNKLEETNKEPTQEVSKKSKTKKNHKIKGETCKFTSVETKQVVKPKEPKTRSKIAKESKPQANKAKFSDLFGDSSSLITPEDLGVVTYQPSASTEIVNKYLPIFEDAQDAIDVKEISQVQTRSKLKDEIKIDETKGEDKDKSKTKTKNAKPMDGKKGKSKKQDILKTVLTKDATNEVRAASPESNNNIQTVVPVEAIDVNIYENLYPEAPTKEPDVIATVIVSSGVQPQCAGSPVELTTQEQIIHENTPCNALIQNSTVQTVQAIATSTPYKPVNKLPVCTEVDKQFESSINSNDSRVVRNVSPSISHSSSTVSSNGMDTRNDNDVPDVRIFVKRRRKVIRK